MSDDKIVYEVEINQPSLPKGEMVQIPGLGVFANGEKHDITKAQAEEFRSFHQYTELQYNEESGEIIGSERVNGPTLLEASKSMYGVEVSTYAKSGGDN